MTRTAKKNPTTSVMNGNLGHNNKKSKSDELRKEKDKKFRQSIVLWKRPLLTIEYFVREVIDLLITYGQK